MQLNRDVPPELNNIIGRALEKDPDLRYQTATGMRADLIRLRRDSSSGQGLVTPPTSSGRSRKRMLGAAAALMVLTAMFFVLWGLPNNDPAQEAATDKKTSQVPSRGPRIAVMPFANASGDPDQEYFSIGLTEDIIRELSRHGELSVIGYRGTEVDVRTIGESHQARYVLHGSVRKDGQRIRVSVQLSGGEDGRSVWANSYIRDLTASDLFELQDELTQHVVNAIAGSYGALTRAELPGARHRPPASLGGPGWPTCMPSSITIDGTSAPARMTSSTGPWRWPRRPCGWIPRIRLPTGRWHWCSFFAENTSAPKPRPTEQCSSIPITSCG
jgi:TolB-like protein